MDKQHKQAVEAQWVVVIQYEFDGQIHGQGLYEDGRTFSRAEASIRAEEYLRSLSAGPDSERVSIVPRIGGAIDWGMEQRITLSPTGSGLIARERQRQVSEGGYDQTHDDQHTDGELASAALAYLAAYDGEGHGRAAAHWPWEAEGFTPNEQRPIWDLIRAGALIAAEIDRLVRAGGTF